MFNTRKALAISVVFLAACTPASSENEVGNSSSSSSMREQRSSIRVTNNVSYQGVVRPAGISIYMEGSHRLELDTGKFILLESDTSTDLNGYVGERVQVFGSVRPTTESDAVIMTVSEISLLQSSVSSSSESFASSTSETVSSDDSEESSLAFSSSSSVVQEISETSSSEQSAVPQLSAALESRIEAMAKEDVSAARWSQQYCTSHIGFCMPVHKNWWFQSFGATATDVWHVEMSMEPLETIHDGPIAVRLLPGSLTAKSVQDGDVVVTGPLVTGYRAWSDNQHFEIVADARLEASVRYITDNLDVYTEE